MKNCYKRIIIMFVMVLTIIGVGAIQNGIIANAATVGQQLFQPEDGWKRYDESNINIKYIGNGWNTYSYSNYYKGTVISSKNLDSMIFYVYSDKVRLIGSITHNYSSKMKIIIDDKEEQLYSQYGNTSYQSVLFEKTNMSKKIHKIELKNLESGWIDLDAVDINENGYLADPNKSISLDKPSLNLKENTSDKLTVTTTSSAVDIQWSSSDENIAKVDENGKVTGVKEGNCIITAQIKGTDIKADCIVTVTKEDTEPKPTDPEQEYIINTAYAKGDNTNNASGQVSIIFKGVTEAQLKVLKTADVDSVYVGDNFTYTIEVANTSDKTAKSVVITDSAPNHIQFIPSGVTTTQGTIDSSSTAKNIIVNVGDIPPSGKVIIKIPVLVVE
ncbi:Ig-like domain-containing protein [uncultured Clostridium sp.]|uniref:Ig-like domain-containing protein n=1 Tax=uncultured Clostridium sp. TaxID=59620 RepID=UPI0028EF8F0F|nr:Ig-like domain-containing protein [uncultured Clostridium sp.]